MRVLLFSVSETGNWLFWLMKNEKVSIKSEDLHKMGIGLVLFRLNKILSQEHWKSVFWNTKKKNITNFQSKTAIYWAMQKPHHFTANVCYHNKLLRTMTFIILYQIPFQELTVILKGLTKMMTETAKWHFIVLAAALNHL